VLAFDRIVGRMASTSGRLAQHERTPSLVEAMFRLTLQRRASTAARSRLRALARAAGLLFAMGSLQCSGPKGSITPRASLLEAEHPLPSATSSAEWLYHPRKPAHLARAYRDTPQRTLFVGAEGERWLTDGGERARPASSLAPEPLVGALARGSSWLFVGQSGTTYEAASELGPLLGASAPLEPLARVDSGDSSLVGVSRNAQLRSSTDGGLSWQAVGPPNARFMDVLLVPPHALALEIPERLWWSADAGRHWQALDEAPFGAERLLRDADAGPVALSVLGARQLTFDPTRADKPPQLSLLGRVSRPEEPELPAPPIEGVSAKAIALGRAFVHGDQYFEVELGVRATSLAGRFAGPLERRSLPAFAACHEIRVGGFATTLYAACTRERAGTTRRFEFWKSEDGGRSFEREAYAARGDPDRLELAVGAGGVLLVTGLCSAREDLPGCRPQGIQQRRSSSGDAGTGFELYPVPTPALEENALALAFSVDGRIAYAVGQRTKGDALFAFVSTDLSRGFTARPIARLEDGGLSGSVQVLAFTPAEDGHLSLVVGQPSGVNRLVILDAGAHTIGWNAAPTPTAALGAYGTRALGISADAAWESLDGGAHWDSIRPPPGSPCSNAAGRCNVPIQCQYVGCAVGESLSRAGWQEPGSDPGALLPPVAAKPGAARRAVGAAFSCELSNTEWTDLDGVDRLPDVSQAALGKTAWFALAAHDATAAAGLWVADAPRANTDRLPSVRYAELFSASERSADTAYFATLQVEGAAALRYKVPGTPGAAPTRLSNVEVAWENLLEGRRGRGVITDAGDTLPGDFSKGEGMARHAQPDLLSIASGGIYVRVHRQPQQQQIAHYLNGVSVETIPSLSFMPAPPKGSINEMARLGKDNIALWFVNQGATVVRACWRAERWQFDAMSMGFTDPESFAVRQGRDITYVAGQAGLHMTTQTPNGSDGALFPLQADGPVLGLPVPVPTQASLGDGVPGCTARQRADTPRVIAPHQPGARHPVFVHDAIEPLRVLLSDAAVLHGTPDAACVEAFDADPVRTQGAPQTTRERALLSPGGLSWLFRVAPENPRRDARIEYRTMKCRLDPGAEVPAEVYELPGTHRDD
jgi:hypothetical protein